MISYLDKYRSAHTTHPALKTFVSDFSVFFEDWANGIASNTFQDALTDKGQAEKNHFIVHTRKTIKALVQAVERGLDVRDTHSMQTGPKVFTASMGVLALLER